MTKRLWKIHSWMGLIAGIALLVIGLTGSLLVFAKELETIFNPQLMCVEKVEATRLPMNTLLRSAKTALPDYEITGWLPRHDHAHLADVYYAIQHGTDVWKVGTIDQFSGKIRATPRDLDATLTGWLLELHYKFFTDHLGMIITAIFGVVLCLLGVTGLWLYRDFWSNFFRLRWRASSRIFFSDLHKTIGITSVVFNLALGFTGAYWNFTHVIGEWMQGEHKQSKLTGPLYPDSISLEALIEESSKKIQGFRANYITLPYEEKGDFMFWGKTESRNPLRGTYGSTVIFDSQTGTLKSAHDIREANLWKQFVDMFEPIHYGNFGGIVAQTIWCLFGLTPGMLAVSGTIIWWKRQRKSGTGNLPKEVLGQKPETAAASVE